MPRPQKNDLTIEPVPGGGFRLFGTLNHTKVRKKSPHKAPLVALRTQLLRAAGLLPANDAAALMQQELNAAIRRIETEFETIKKILRYTPGA